MLIPPEAGATLLVEHVETRIHSEDWRKAILALLDGTSAGCVILTSEIDPLHHLTQRMREKCDYFRSIPTDDKEKEKRAAAEKAYRDMRHDLVNWATALRSVHKIRQVVPRIPEIPPDADHLALRVKLANECRSTEPLVAIGNQLLQRPDIYLYRWDDIVGFVLDAAEPYYRSVWELCSREERLVLIQLAQVGLVNPKRSDIVRRLARRGLVLVDSRIRVMSKSFERFVCSAEPPERVTEWERSGGAVPWSRLGTPLYALAGVVIAVLLFAEQGLFANILAIATGSATALGSLRGIYASVTKAVPGAAKVA